MRSNVARFLGGALSGAVLLVELLAGLLLTLVITFFFVKDGERFWSWFVGLFSADRLNRVRAAGEGSWGVLGGYVRGTVGVAAIDALLIGVALMLIGVPLVIPLAVLTFIGGLVPIVGAFAAGIVAVLVALGTEGATAALLTLAAIVVVQQIEGNLVAPLLVGRSVKVHPIIVLVAVTVGGVVWGVLGAFVAVPLAAVLRAVATSLRERAPSPQAVPADEETSEA